MTPPVSISQTRPGHVTATFTVDPSALPYLNDHSFQNMVVLPGAFYVEMARAIERQMTGRTPAVLERLTFHSPVILSGDATIVHVDVTDVEADRVLYSFREATAATPSATLQVDRHGPVGRRPTADRDFFDRLRGTAETSFDQTAFYDRLRRNGNQYGPAFQRIRRIWSTGSETAAEISLADRLPGESPVALLTTALDAATQTLIPFTVDSGHTFILRSIERVTLWADEVPTDVIAHARLADGAGTDSAGDVDVHAESGAALCALTGVAFSLLEQGAAVDAVPALRLAVAANFTAEPLAEPLKFWAARFGLPLDIAFAPYNQVFQQLLQAGSVFHDSRNGLNVVLLRLEEWLGGRRRALLDGTTAAVRLAGLNTCTLPNGLTVAHLNQYETDHLYKEIFAGQAYLRHGIQLPDDATVVDIGANIGLFSLFVMDRCRQARVIAFEPAPTVHALLKANCEAYGARVEAVNAGVSATPGSAVFTFYEKSSVFSGFHADAKADRDAIRAVVRNAVAGATGPSTEGTEALVEELTTSRLQSTRYECRLTSVSEIIREHGLDRIDLLKIDAEKSELGILAGIADADWPRIGQIVMEVHDPGGAAVAQILHLLDTRGFRCAVDHDASLAGSGLVNLYAARAGEAVAASGDSPLAQTVSDFTAALRAFAADGRTAPVGLCLCPSSPDSLQDGWRRAVLLEAERALLEQARAIPGVHVIESATVLARYPVVEYDDPHSNQAGHVPYTAEGFAAIGTSVFRLLHMLKQPARKVVALDCDNTLWKGVCGEDGPHGIEIGEPYRRLQQFMLDQARSGMLLCLCSRNNEQDVLDVFAERKDMPLALDAFVARRLNWGSKSQNLRALAAELNVGLDSIVFVDDNPVECAEVRSSCPEVLTLQLPDDPALIPTFLAHVWAFDRAAVTDEDRRRTQMYQANTERKRFQQAALSLREFIDGLDLQIRIEPPSPADLPRLAQLTVRTNQFNFTTIRRTEAEIREFLQRPAAGGFAVRVSDRFGDYGLVGLVLFVVTEDRLRVDTCLLSCRVLGKGVEHAVLAALGRRAQEARRPMVALTCRTTAKNAPVLEFMARIGPPAVAAAEVEWRLDASMLASLKYDPDRLAAPQLPERDDDVTMPAHGHAFGTVDPSSVLQAVAETGGDVRHVAREPDGELAGSSSGESARPLQAATLDDRMLSLWRRVLGRPSIGAHDNFFDAGGTSLKAVQLVAAIRRELGVAVSIVTLFECPTVARLAERLNAPPSGHASTEAADAALRGQKRRPVKRRKAS